MKTHFSLAHSVKGPYDVINLVTWNKLQFLDSNNTHECSVKMSIKIINSAKNGNSFNF